MFKTPPNYSSLAEALVSLFGTSISIVHTDRLSGGDINKAYALTLSNGKKIFMKANAKENASFFTAESLALSAIESTKTIKTPEILCTGTEPGEEVGYSFLFLEYIESSQKIKNYWELFGRELADLHKANTKRFTSGKKFGFLQDNFIGAKPQKNVDSDSWVDFFRDSRLAPKFKNTDSFFDENDRKKITKLLDHLGDFLVEPESPSLLHGDLWNGNVMCGSDGKAWLIDPASYVGHCEADLAMTELFGGFPKEFYKAYKEANPLQTGYEERRDLYNLYHLLNHLEMFGSGYLNAVKSILREYM
ncbi:fructosamine kinase family protein [Treponema sp.]|uniref:fructosamine kinase family protein n=1 Tax=Treponema sp. TaxID=166 RepID=UPI003890799E